MRDVDMFFTFRLGPVAILKLKNLGTICTNDGTWRRLFWRVTVRRKRK